jgi:5-methylcytosine-specific restriction endonuclease McrA
MALQVHMTLLEDLKRACWARTNPVSGQPHAWEFRKDPFGNLVRYGDFGNRHSPFGWEIDYIVPRALGGSSNPENVQVLHWKANAARGDQIPRGLSMQEELGIEQAVVPA